MTRTTSWLHVGVKLGLGDYESFDWVEYIGMNFIRAQISHICKLVILRKIYRVSMRLTLSIESYAATGMLRKEGVVCKATIGLDWKRNDTSAPVISY